MAKRKLKSTRAILNRCQRLMRKDNIQVDLASAVDLWSGHCKTAGTIHGMPAEVYINVGISEVSVGVYSSSAALNRGQYLWAWWYNTATGVEEKENHFLDIVESQ